MVHEKTANQVIVVAETGWLILVRSQQDARILDAACGEHKNSSGHAGCAASQRLHPDAPHCLRPVSFDINGIGIEINGHMFRSRQVLPVKFAEANGWAELRDDVDDPAAREGESANVGVTDCIDPERRVEPVRTELENAV